MPNQGLRRLFRIIKLRPCRLEIGTVVPLLPNVHKCTVHSRLKDIFCFILCSIKYNWIVTGNNFWVSEIFYIHSGIKWLDFLQRVQFPVYTLSLLLDDNVGDILMFIVREIDMAVYICKYYVEVRKQLSKIYKTKKNFMSVKRCMKFLLLLNQETWP